MPRFPNHDRYERSFVVVNHGANAAKPRPFGAGAVYWIGSVKPNNLGSVDLWYDTAGSVSPAVEYVQFWCSDLTTAITAGTGKGYWYPPSDITVTGVRVNLVSACSTGTFTVDINDGGTSILSTKITVDATEDTSETAATPPVISDTSILDGAEVTVDVDDDGDGTATGLLVTIFYTEA